MNQVKANVGFGKYTWITLDIKERTDDFRPESYSPLNYEVQIGEKLNTENFWAARKEFCLNNVYTNKSQLLSHCKAPANVSLATFKPSTPFIAVLTR